MPDPSTSSRSSGAGSRDDWKQHLRSRLASLRLSPAREAEITDEFLQQDFDQKLFAAIRLTRLVWPQMKERRWGRIINVLNIGAKAPRGGSAPTSITRAAGMALTKVL